MRIAWAVQSVEYRKRQLLFIFTLIFSLATTVLLNSSPSIRVQSDLYTRWYAANKLIESGRSIYDLQNSREIATLRTYPAIDLDARFYYPAHLLILLIPLAFLPFKIANFIWLLLIQLLYIAAIWLLVKELDWPKSANGLTALLLLSLFFIPFIQHTIWSQFNTLGLFALVMAYLAIRRDRYVIAGIWTAGLTFKPQGNLLVIVFILIWALSSRIRWKLFWSFFVTTILLWGFTEIIQPGWVAQFLKGLQDYQTLPYEQRSVLDKIWNPFHLLTIIALMTAIGVFIKYRQSQPGDTSFNACLLIAVSVWWLVVPILGMLHLVLFPILLIIMFSELKNTWPNWVRPALISWIILYTAGYAGFFYGLASPERYGLQIELSEFAYKNLANFLILGTSILLLLKINKLSLPPAPSK